MRVLAPIALLVFSAACSRTEDARASTTPATAGAPAAATSAAAPAADTSSKAVLHAADLARILGDANAKLWLVEVGDLECPVCRVWHDSSFAMIKKDFIDTGKIRFAYLNYPLPQHPHAWPAAEVAMCAGAQGKFWPVHDTIFTTQDRWNRLQDALPTFLQLAAVAGADSAAVRQCVSQHVMRPLIEADQQRARNVNVTSTPTFIIGNQILPGNRSAQDLAKTLNAMLAQTPAK